MKQPVTDDMDFGDKNNDEGSDDDFILGGSKKSGA